MFEEHGNTTPMSWNKCPSNDIRGQPLVENTSEGFSLRLLHHEVVAEWLLCRQETAVPATAIDEATCFVANSQGIVSADTLIMLYPVGMVDSILLGYSFSETNALNNPSKAAVTCRRFAFDTTHWEYLELFWFSNATVTVSWIKFFPNGKRIRYFVFYEAPPEGKLPYKLLHSFELIGYRSTIPKVENIMKGVEAISRNESPLGVQDSASESLSLFGCPWNQNKLCKRKGFQLLQQLYVGEYRGSQRFTKYQVNTGHILEEHVDSFSTIIEPLDASTVELEKAKEMQRLCFLPRARVDEMSRKLHEILVEAGILLEYFGPDHIVNEQAKQKRMERKIMTKRKRGKPCWNESDIDQNNRPYQLKLTTTFSSRNTCSTNRIQCVASDKRQQQQQLSSSTVQVSSPVFESTNVQRKRIMREEDSWEHKRRRRENMLPSLVSTTDSRNPSYMTWKDNNMEPYHGDSFDPSQVTDEPTSEYHRVNLMLAPYMTSSSIQGDMIGFSDEKERIWMFHTTEPEIRHKPYDEEIPCVSREYKEISNSFHPSEDDWIFANDALLYGGLGEEWPSNSPWLEWNRPPPPQQQQQQLDSVYPRKDSHKEDIGEEVFSVDSLWNHFHDNEWQLDLLSSSESNNSNDWFIKTLALEDSCCSRYWKEMDSGVAQVEQVEKRSSF